MSSADRTQFRYRHLDATKIVATAEALSQRIHERFPNSGLSRVSEELLAVTREGAGVSEWLGRRHLGIRAIVGLAILFLPGILAAAFITAIWKSGTGEVFSNFSDMLQGIEAAINEIVLTGVAIFFLLSLESRWKRTRALKAIHELRSLAHIIDMHQLTKDPDRISHPEAGADTPSSPKRQLTPFELARYLDYCSESLAVISKVGALYVQNYHDALTLSAVNDLEDLAAGLSRKIWQKIMTLDRFSQPLPASPPAAASAPPQENRSCGE